MGLKSVLFLVGISIFLIPGVVWEKSYRSFYIPVYPVCIMSGGGWDYLMEADGQITKISNNGGCYEKGKDVD